MSAISSYLSGAVGQHTSQVSISLMKVVEQPCGT